MSISNHGRHRDSITSEELLKEIQRIPIQRGDGKGSFAVRSKTLHGSNDANCIVFLVMKTCFLNLASSSMHSVSPPLSRCAHCKGESVHVRSKANPNNLDPSVEIMEPQNVASSWNTTFCIFFLSCRLSRSNRWYSECILMEGDTHAFCVFFFAPQSMASKPPAVTLGCKVYRLWTYENKRDIVVWTCLKHGIISCLGDWPLCHKCGQWCKCLVMMLLMLRNLQHYFQLVTSCQGQESEDLFHKV